MWMNDTPALAWIALGQSNYDDYIDEAGAPHHLLAPACRVETFSEEHACFCTDAENLCVGVINAVTLLAKLETDISQSGYTADSRRGSSHTYLQKI